MITFVYYLNLIHDDILKLRQGSTIPRITMDVINKIKIPIPSNKSLIQSLEPSFQRIAQLNEEIREAEKEYESVLINLSEDIKSPSTDTKQPTDEQLNDEPLNGEVKKNSEDDSDPNDHKVQYSETEQKKTVKVNKNVKVIVKKANPSNDGKKVLARKTSQR